MWQQVPANKSMSTRKQSVGSSAFVKGMASVSESRGEESLFDGASGTLGV